MERKRRSILKALSYRVLGILITTTIAFVLTGKMDDAFKIGLLDAAIKIFVFYFHERLWLRISYGLRKPPEYKI